MTGGLARRSARGTTAVPILSGTRWVRGGPVAPIATISKVKSRAAGRQATETRRPCVRGYLFLGGRG